MHKVIACTVKILLLMAISNNCLSQTETFDIITYTPPKGFKKDLKNGVITYSVSTPKFRTV